MKQTMEFLSHEVFIEEVIETHSDEKYMTDGALDLAKVQPILYGPNAYWSIGAPFAKAFSVGKEMKRNKLS